jgi:Na+-translocating ferredoxin:NAD+ oxidoreductase RnfG subunit
MTRLHVLALPAVLAAADTAHATTYHTVEGVQKACFPSATRFESADVHLTRDQMKAIERESGVRVRTETQKVWRALKGTEFLGWLLVDEVIGKHEYITYALALDPAGSVSSVEIMEYRENYGYEVRNADWRLQFRGRKPGTPVRLGQEIRNISGATLSCRHVTEGVQRLLTLHALVLRK